MIGPARLTAAELASASHARLAHQFLLGRAGGLEEAMRLSTASRDLLADRMASVGGVRGLAAFSLLTTEATAASSAVRFARH